MTKAFDTMVTHHNPDIRQNSYLFLTKEVAKGHVRQETLHDLLMREINNRNFSTNIIYMTCKYTPLLKHIFIASDDVVLDYIKEKEFSVDKRPIRDLVRLYLLRLLPSTELRDHIASFIFSNPEN